MVGLTLRIDNKEVEVPPGATILDAARKLGIDIPALCHRDGCAPNTSCLACVVKVGASPRLVPSCATKAADGMVVLSEAAEVHDARRMALELLLSDHAGDCLAPCQNVCPAHMDIPRMIQQISAGQLHEALVTVKQTIALPAVLGRICPELCEKGCRRGAADQSVSICRLKRHVADVDLDSGKPYLPPCLPATGKRVAIIGAGPTGLAAAYYLQQQGHQCVLLDEHSEAGGNLRYAIGEDKLPRRVLDAEIDLIAQLGAQFSLNVRVGPQISLADLRKQYDAVLVAGGQVDAARAAELGLELAGRGLKTNQQTMMTALDGIFAAGAAVTPFRHAVRGVAEGKQAAGLLDSFLRGIPLAPAAAAFTVRLGVLNPAEVAAFSAGASTQPRADGQSSLCLETAPLEAQRCLHCDCGKLDGCALRNYAIAYQANPTRYKSQRRPFERISEHNLVTYEPGKCISCGLCVQITQTAQEPLGLTFIGRGFNVRISAPFNQAMSQALQTVAAECAHACPTGAIVLKHP